MKSNILNLLLMAVLSLAACHNHDDETVPYVVNIAINKPTANQSVVKNTVLPIEVVVTRENNATIHNIKVEIVDANGATVETLIEKHYHASGSATYTEGAYKPQTAGSFKLRVTSTNDSKLEPNTKEVSFSVTN